MSRVLPNLPDPNPNERGWQHLRFTSFEQDVHETRYIDDDGNEQVIGPTFLWIGALCAMRTDGVMFYIRLTVPGTEDSRFLAASAPELGADLANAMLSLEDFRTCDCRYAARCERHRLMFDAPAGRA